MVDSTTGSSGSGTDSAIGSRPVSRPVKELPSGRTWLQATAVVGLLWLVLGVICFGLGAQSVADRFGPSLHGAFVLDLVFAGGVLIVISVIVGWQRVHGETLRDLGWRAPTRPAAVAIGIVYGAAWTVSSYLRGGDPFAWSWERPVMAAIGLLLAFGEELAVRGFLLEQLRRGGVPTWVQIVVSGLVMGVYHGLIGFHYSIPYAIASAVLFGLVSVIFVIGKRSLTPGFIAHAMTHVFGDPVLVQSILYGVQAM